MSTNEIAIVVLAAVALILALIDEAQASWKSTTQWAIILVAVALLVLVFDPL